MLRDFGLVTLIDLSVSLVGVLVALPAALLLAERGSGSPGSACGRRRGGVAGARRRERAAAREPGPSDAPSRPRYGATCGLLGLADPRADHAQRGAHEPERGGRHRARPALPPFAVPLALGTLKGDAEHRDAADDGAAGKRAGVHGARAADPQRLRALRTGAAGAGAVRRRRVCPRISTTCRRSCPRSRACASRRSRSRAIAANCASWCTRRGLSFPVGIDKTAPWRRCTRCRAARRSRSPTRWCGAEQGTARSASARRAARARERAGRGARARGWRPPA